MKNSLKIVVPINERPRCAIDGCDRPGQHTGNYLSNGYPIFRKYCNPHHIERGERFNELKANTDRRSAPKCGAVGCNKKTSLSGTDINGQPLYTTYCPDHLNLSTAYLGFRKDYCENIDGRLGHVCTTTITRMALLQVDHIDGNPQNNDPSNLQTLCACCHIEKTLTNKDYLSPGRKSLGIKA